MKNWHLLYNTTTGASISIGTVITDPLPSGITDLPLTDEQGDGLQNGSLKWDASTRTLIPTPLPVYTAEQWLFKEGYGPTQLVTLLDLYATLSAAGKTSAKLNAVKAWTNSVLGEYVQNSQPKSDWGAAPFSFNETVIEAYQELGQ